MRWLKAYLVMQGRKIRTVPEYFCGQNYQKESFSYRILETQTKQWGSVSKPISVCRQRQAPNRKSYKEVYDSILLEV
jgi:hypothetical protein